MDSLKNYIKGLTETPQDEPIPGSKQVPNSAGGYAWAVDDWTRLMRFLILGSEGGTYYISERKLTQENAEAVARCIAEDGERTVRTIVEVSEAGRAPKNDPAIFALALCATLGDQETKRAAFDAVPRVCRTGTHLFHFAQFVDGLRGWGRGLREAVAEWYAMPPRKLALQAIKYQSRDGWAHRDLLRLAHPKPPTTQHEEIYGWMVRGWDWVGEEPHPDEALRIIWAMERAKRARTDAEVVALVREYDLPREAIPTEWLNSPDVWEALLAEMPLEATVRNLAKMTTVGLLKPNSEAARLITRRLRDGERIRKARLHPIKVLAALKTYEQGRGERGKLTWTPVTGVVDALNDAFYLAFGAVESTGKKWLLALDVSGSMGYGNISGIPGLTPRVASAAMSLVTAATEPQHTIVAFSAAKDGYGGQWGGGESGLTPVKISPKQRLDDVLKATDAIPMGGTDCALPMKWALKNKVEADVFVVYCMDTETEILTSQGWRGCAGLNVRDQVYTLNHQTGLGEWQSVSAVNIFPPARRLMLRMEGRGHSSLSTLNHRWPVRHRGNSTWGRRWRTSETLSQVDYVQCAAPDASLPTTPKFPDAFVELMAWVWTEGHVDGSGRISVCQSHVANPGYCEEIEAALHDYLGPPTQSMLPLKGGGQRAWRRDNREGRGTAYWYLNKAAAQQFLEWMSAPEKVVSIQFLRSLTRAQLERYISTSLRADGYEAKRRLAQKSKARAESFQVACTLAGYATSIVHVNNYHNDLWEVGILARTQFAPLQNATNKDERPFVVEQVEHEGAVWCPTTPNGTWLARRNGTVYWTGNTDSETWAGPDMHPVQALRKYREKMGIPAKLMIVGMVSNNFTIADPDDAGMLDVVGFDTAVPQVMSDFAIA